MKYVDFFGHKVSKLIMGDNPFNGHSYITEFFSKEEMRNFHTEEKIIEALHTMEEMGVNTILPLADPFIIRVLTHYRANGGKMNFIFQTYAPMMVNLDVARISINQMMALNPIGIYISGTFTDVRFETDRVNEIKDMISLFKEFDVKLGLGTHRPELIELSEKENWPIDFYMACMYNLRKGREGTESGFITGQGKTFTHSNFVPTHRQIMLDTLKGIEKPIIAFKIFAGGQLLVEKEEKERREIIKDVYETIFTQLKPDDFAVAGVFQKYHDQIRENVEAFNEWAAEKE